jgi:signal transduction histidine kinase
MKRNPRVYRERVVRRPAMARWLTDAGIAAAVLAAAEIAIVTGREADATPRDWPAYLLGVAMAAPVLLRRRFPAWSLYLVAAALLVFYSRGYPGFPPSLVLAVPLYDSVRAGRLWWALPVPVAFLSAGYAVTVRHGTPPLDAVAVFLPEIALVAVAMLLGGLVRSRRAYAAEVRERLRLAELEREHEAEGRVVAERLRIARELHDTVAHAIATITVQSGVALHLLDREPGGARDALTAIRQTGKEALAEMRSTLDALREDGRPSAAADRDAGLGRLPDLLSAVRAAGLDVQVDGDAADGRLAEPVDHAAYRILQESLTNTLRHAGPAARARVRLRWATRWLDIEVSDDGVGADGADGAGSDGGHGLAGMRERAEGLGGRFEAGPGPGGGFAVRVRLPREAV